MVRPLSPILGSLAVLALGATASAQNVQLGGSRAAGMGGAGLAYPQNIGQARSNPALLGFEKMALRLNWPSIGFHTRGISYGDASEFFGSIGGGGLTPGKLGKFAQTLGDKEKAFGVYGDLGAKVGPFAFSLGGDSLANTVPNASLASKVRNGQTNFGPGDALDGYGFGYFSFNMAYGHLLNVGHDNLQKMGVGAQLRYINTYYAHHLAGGNDIAQGGGSSPALEMNGANVLHRSGVAMDVGFQAIAARESNLFLAGTIENFIPPDVGYATTKPYDQSSSIVGESSVNPFRQKWSVGLAYQPISQVLLAADYVDIYNQRGEKEVRLGAEYMLNKNFGGRVGFSGRNGPTLGFTVGGFNVAISKRQALSITSAFHF